MKIPEMPGLSSDGEPLVVPEPGTDVAHLIYLLEYARRRGFKVGPNVQLGSIALQVHDMRQIEEGDLPDEPDDPDIAMLRG